MPYVDGFLIPVPKKKLAAYKKLSAKAGKLWMKYGALSYVETVADDVKVGKVTSFPQAVKLKAGEVVIFSWITYKSRKDRDRVNKAVMSDPMLQSMTPSSMPFDGKRLIFGGFKSFVDL